MLSVRLYNQPQVLLLEINKEEVLIVEKKTKGGQLMDESSLSHTRCKCQYHIVIVPSIDAKRYMKNYENISERYFEDYVNTRKLKL